MRVLGVLTRMFAVRTWGVPLGVGLSLLAAAPVVADVLNDPEPPRAKRKHDIELVVHVRNALRQDRELSLLRLRVSVREGVAYLEGEVSSEEQLRKAVERVAKVQGIYEVKTDRVVVV